MRTRKSVGIVLGCVALAASTPAPWEIPPTKWPIERIVENLEGLLLSAPDDEETHYSLGRAHGFAFALEREHLLAYYESALADLDEQDAAALPEAEEQVLDPARSLEHLTQGVLHLRRACELGSADSPSSGRELLTFDRGRELLTFAWLLETGAHLADRVDSVSVLGLKPAALATDDRSALERSIRDLGSSDAAAADAAWKALAAPANLERAAPALMAHAASSDARRQRAVARLLERYWIERAIDAYWRAAELAFAIDVSGIKPRNEDERKRMVSYEALAGYERLVRARGVQGPDEERRLVEVARKRKEIEALPLVDWITPILLSLDGCASLDQLVAPELAVPFDLDGDGDLELWPWIQPSTGWLVWDPERRGEITSGRDLFGTASAWLFFEDGYRVLDALDDDRSGELRGDELTGIAVWFDRDTDGVSDRGEVIPVEELGIVALATHATELVGRSPANPGGLELADGRVLPTYDWVLQPVSE